ncbi:hypothetical protein SY83_21250 [Paenibacillus swuensis]|uniref:AraC family transcriptional regulator n=1 Tax=Paenibacillus swuensis TaxID=1178515 RepID=A0A172TNJ2_9BACL|nr:response regulator [Paenibacillus swuensis]ANE48387.1 hypothetical protein SY83_21250 [Paenibacillus swuensis]
MLEVMIVEDEMKIREGIRKVVECVEGYKVTAEASDGASALNQIRGGISADLLISDIRMEGMSGLEMIKEIRETGLNLRVLIISGYGDFQYARLALRYGVADYLLKPVNHIELTQFLMNYKKERTSQLPVPSSASEENQGLGHERKIIKEVKAMIQQKLAEEITLRSVADQVFLNPKYLSVLFKSETGTNFSDYVEACRMEKAKKLIRDTHLKVYEIAGMCGYNNPKHFMVVFKQQTGMTPSEYRDFK